MYSSMTRTTWSCPQKGSGHKFVSDIWRSSLHSSFTACNGSSLFKRLAMRAHALSDFSMPVQVTGRKTVSPDGLQQAIPGDTQDISGGTQQLVQVLLPQCLLHSRRPGSTSLQAARIGSLLECFRLMRGSLLLRQVVVTCQLCGETEKAHLLRFVGWFR